MAKKVLLAGESWSSYTTHVKGDVYKRQQQGFAALDALNARTGVPVPQSLAQIRDLPVLHSDIVDRKDMLSYVKEAL